jgi:hypothetical protein
MAGSHGIIKDVELSRDGTLFGQVYTPDGKAVADANVFLRYQGTAVATARSDADGRFAITDVRGGAHEVVVGALNRPVRLWASGTSPQSATQSIVLSADETIVRGQDVYCDSCPPGGACSPSGFGLLDVITLATVGSAVGALVMGIENHRHLQDIEAAIGPASP